MNEFTWNDVGNYTRCYEIVGQRTGGEASRIYVWAAGPGAARKALERHGYTP